MLLGALGAGAVWAALRPPIATETTPPPVAVPDVVNVDVQEAMQFLAGRHPEYPGSSLDSAMSFSAANIIETMDNDLLERVEARSGRPALDSVYAIASLSVLDALLAIYRDRPVVVALDAGHGGKPDVYYDPGAGVSEAIHTRQFAEKLESVAVDPRYKSITIRRIYNDEIGDDFDMPRGYDCDGTAQRAMRNVRAAMLAHAVNSPRVNRVTIRPAVHMLSLHFNVDSGGVIVLHQGDAAPVMFRNRSIDFAEAYLEFALPRLNQSGLLPVTLRPAQETGMTNDLIQYAVSRCYAINPITGVDSRRLTRRYGMLQGSQEQRDFLDGVLRQHGLVSA